MNTQTINISLPKQLVKIMDEKSKAEYLTRSDLIRTAIISYIDREKRWESIFTYGSKKFIKSKIKENNIEKIVDQYRQNK